MGLIFLSFAQSKYSQYEADINTEYDKSKGSLAECPIHVHDDGMDGCHVVMMMHVMEWMTVKEAGELWGFTTRRATILCADGKVEGAQKLGNFGLFPKIHLNQLTVGLKPQNALSL